MKSVDWTAGIVGAVVGGAAAYWWLMREERAQNVAISGFPTVGAGLSAMAKRNLRDPETARRAWARMNAARSNSGEEVIRPGETKSVRAFTPMNGEATIPDVVAYVGGPYAGQVRVVSKVDPNGYIQVTNVSNADVPVSGLTFSLGIAGMGPNQHTELSLDSPNPLRSRRAAFATPGWRGPF